MAIEQPQVSMQEHGEVLRKVEEGIGEREVKKGQMEQT